MRIKKKRKKTALELVKDQLQWLRATLEGHVKMKLLHCTRTKLDAWTTATREVSQYMLIKITDGTTLPEDGNGSLSVILNEMTWEKI